MSNINGPVGRRRIAGEGKPAAPGAKKAPVRKAPVRKPSVAKAPVARRTPVVTSAPVARKTESVTVPTARTRPVTAPAAPTARTADRSGPTRRDLRWLVPLTLAAVGALVAGILVLANGLEDEGGDSAVDTARRQATAAAATAAETVFSYRYDALDEHLSSSQALMTPSYAEKFGQYEPALAEIAPQGKFVLESVTREAAALECGDECSPTKVNVLVFYDQARLTNGSKQPTVFSNRATVSMVKRDGGWLVDDIRSLGS